jgi:hypothetical protein
MPIDDVYRDTDERYLRDPDFRAAVKTLEAMAVQHGFTPGELKQIAFKAALNIEERRLPGPPLLRSDQLSEGAKLRSMERLNESVLRGVMQLAGYLKDGTPVFFGKEP